MSAKNLFLVLVAMATGLAMLVGVPAVSAQDQGGYNTPHYLYDYGMPPGMVAHRKLLARQSTAGYYQPVRILGPEGARIEVFSEGSFYEAKADANIPGMMVGNVYRLKITNMPGYPGREIFPSIEIIGRLFPPPGKEVQFPLPVVLSMNDLEPAIQGSLLTRVVYLENPRTAIAEQRKRDDQPFFDVGLREDPIRAAEKFGRPMAIVRLGSRIPDADELNAFGFGTPPLMWFDSSTDEPQFAPEPQGVRMPPWPDELLIDGGDRDLKAVVADKGDRWEVRGLDSEDTVAHFDTLDGQRIVDTSNRVGIYAPRFSAVRKIDNLGRTKFSQEIGHVGDDVGTRSSLRTDFSSTTLQHLQPARHKRTFQPAGLESQTRGLRLDSGTQINQFDGTFSTYENLKLIRLGFYDSREKGRLAISMKRANTWDTTISAQSTVRNLQLVIVDDVKKVEETVHVKTEFNRPQLRLVKVASADVAHPGDIIEFTIRFDNVGDQPIGNVTIMDSLTGRLAYVEDSAECSIECNFIQSPNDSGSQTLRWEIDEPIKATKGGVIRFKCQVR